MKILYGSILSSTNSGIYAIGETIYNKLLNGEKLTVRELKWTNTNVGVFKVNREQLINLINKLKIYNISLNWLDVSNITNMTNMFAHLNFNGDISKWDVRKVSDMSYMFYNSNFNNDISKWDINKDTNTTNMFNGCPIKEEYKTKNIKN